MLIPLPRFHAVGRGADGLRGDGGDRRPHRRRPRPRAAQLCDLARRRRVGADRCERLLRRAGDGAHRRQHAARRDRQRRHGRALRAGARVHGRGSRRRRRCRDRHGRCACGRRRADHRGQPRAAAQAPRGRMDLRGQSGDAGARDRGRGARRGGGCDTRGEWRRRWSRRPTCRRSTWGTTRLPARIDAAARDSGRRAPRVAQAYIAPTAVLAGDVTVADDASVYFGCAVVAGDGRIVIGPRTNVQDNSLLVTDASRGPLLARRRRHDRAQRPAGRRHDRRPRADRNGVAGRRRRRRRGRRLHRRARPGRARHRGQGGLDLGGPAGVRSAKWHPGSARCSRRRRRSTSATARRIASEPGGIARQPARVFANAVPDAAAPS